MSEFLTDSTLPMSTSAQGRQVAVLTKNVRSVHATARTGARPILARYLCASGDIARPSLRPLRPARCRRPTPLCLYRITGPQALAFIGYHPIAKARGVCSTIIRRSSATSGEALAASRLST